MIRFAVLAAVALAALVPARAGAQPPNSAPGGFRVVEAKAEKDKVTWTQLSYVVQQKEEERVVNIGGMNVKQKVTVNVFVPTYQTTAHELKKLKATDGAGKAIDADKLAELLKEKTPVVIVFGPVDEKHRKLFKETTVFIEPPQPEAPKLPPPPAK